MPRSPRIEYAGALFHVTDRGNDAADIFHSDGDRRLFLKLLRESCAERGWRCLAYCLMTNHYHLLLRTDTPGLSGGMQLINARYAEHFNFTYAHSGHVFQGRYGARHIERDSYLLEVIRYIALNPVRAGLCRAPGAWIWSSYAAVLGNRTHTNWFDRASVLALFGSTPDDAVRRYIDFIARGDPHARLADTALKRARRERDAAVRAAYAAGNVTVEAVAKQFRISLRTAARALRRHATEGSDPAVACQEGV